MPMPTNSIASTMTAIVQCRIRENAVNCRRPNHGHAPLPPSGDLDGARLLLLPRAPGEGCGIGGRSRTKQRIVGRFYPGGQHQRIEIDITTVARRFGLDVVDRQGADILMLANARPWRCGIVRRIAKAGPIATTRCHSIGGLPACA